jgi:hypothetical protein
MMLAASERRVYVESLVRGNEDILVLAFITAGIASSSRYICLLRQAWNFATSLTTTPNGSSAATFL